MVRYADDFVILCRSEKEAVDALTMVKQWTSENGLTLHPEKTHVIDATQKGGFNFLGCHFERGYRWPRRKSLNKLKDTVRSKTKRTNGESLQEIILDVSATLAGWFEYFKHSHRTTFRPLDGWIRMRLRSILRKRQGGSRGSSILSEMTCQPESRVREIRTHGSEGGGAGYSTSSSYLYQYRW